MMRTENKTRPELLSFTDFMAAFRAQIEYGPMKLKKKFSVSEQVIHKNNKDLHGLIVRVPGNKIAPVFYYEDFYDAYKKGSSIEACIESIIEFISEKNLPGEEFGEFFTCWNNVKDHLIIKMMNIKKNRDVLAHTPYHVYGDMAVVIQIYLDDPNIGRGAVLVDDSLLTIWGKNREIVFEIAMANMNKYRIKALDLLDFAEDEELVDRNAPKVFVISYDAPFYGAAAMLRNDFLFEFARKNGKDYYLLPVSVHEFLLVEQNDEVAEKTLFSILRSINSDKSLADNMLSDEVFVVSRNDNCLRYLSDGKELRMCIH